jgi:hypothetical protein
MIAWIARRLERLILKRACGVVAREVAKLPIKIIGRAS